ICLFNKKESFFPPALGNRKSPGLKPRQTRLSTRSEATGACGGFFSVMQYIEGFTLEQYMESCGGNLSLDEVLDIALQLCMILEYLHRQGQLVIFRDLKPANVMCMPEGRIVLNDFFFFCFFRLG